MAVDYSQFASTDPTQVALADPALQSDPTLGSLGSTTVGATGQNPDLSRSTVDFNSLGLSGESYVPPDQAAGAATAVSSDPNADTSLTDLGQAGPQPPVQGLSFDPKSLIGKTQDEIRAMSQQPQQASGVKLDYNMLLGKTQAEIRAMRPSAMADLSGLGQSNAPSRVQYGNDPVGQLLQAEEGLSPELRTGVHSFQENILPSAAGLGGSIAAGALIGSVIGPEGTLAGALVGLGAGLVGGFLAQGAAQKAQDAIAQKLIPDEDIQTYEKERQQEEALYPLQNLGGQFAAQAVMLRPSFANVSQAARTAGRILTTRTFDGIDETSLKVLTSVVFGAGTQGGLEAWNQIQQGNFQPAMLASSLLAGSLLTEPTRLGRMMGLSSPHDLDNMKAGQGAAAHEMIDEMQKSASSDPTGQLAELLKQAKNLADTGHGVSSPEVADLINRAQNRITEIRQANPEAATPVEGAVQGAEAIGNRPRLGPTFNPDDRVRGTSGNTGTIIGKGRTSSAQFKGSGLYEVRWDNGVTTTLNGRQLTLLGEENGIQTQTTGVGQGVSQAGQISQTQGPSEAGIPGQIQGQASGIQQAQGGQIGPEAGNAATDVSRPNAATDAAANAQTTNAIARSSVATQRSAAETGISPTSGLTGRRYASDVVAQLHPDQQTLIHAAAGRLGLDLTRIEIPGDAPIPQPVILTPEEKALPPGDPNYIADQSTPVPSEDGVDFLSGPVTDLMKALQDRRGDIGNLPVKLNSDAERMLLTFIGWDGRFFYERSHDFITDPKIGMKFPTPEHAELFKALLGVYGQGQPTYLNALDAVRAYSRILSEVYGPDLKDYAPHFDLGILKKSKAKISFKNVYDAVFKHDVDTTKIKAYLRAILDRNSTEFPIDEWMKRLYSGKDGSPQELKGVQAGRNYETGRTRYVARMFGIENPKQAQAALWIGYKRVVAAYIRDLVAKSAEYPELKSLAKDAASGLSAIENGDDFQTIFETKLGMSAGHEPPILEIHSVVSRYKEALFDLSREHVQVAYDSSDKLFLNIKGDLDQALLKKDAEYPGLVSALASMWERYYVDKDASALHSLNVVNQDFGKVGEELARRSYQILYPDKGIEEVAGQLGVALDRSQGLLRQKTTIGPSPDSYREEAMAQVAPLDPHGVMELHYRLDPASTAAYGGGYFEWTDPTKAWLTADPQLILKTISDKSLPRVRAAAQQARRDKAYDAKGLTRLLSNLELALTNPAEFTRRRILAVWSHEVIHGIQARMLGLVNEAGQLVVRSPLDHARLLMIGKRALPVAYWELAARRGLGHQVDDVLQATTGLTLKQHIKLQEYEAAKASGKKISEKGPFSPKEQQEIAALKSTFGPLDEEFPTRLTNSVYAIMEDIDQLTANHYGVPFSEFTSIPGELGEEVLSRDFDGEAKTRQQAEDLIGNWYRQNLSDPEVANALAKEAQAGRIRRGESSPSNPLRNATPRTDAGVRSSDRGILRVATRAATGSNVAGAAAPGPGFERIATGQPANPTAPNQNIVANVAERYAGLNELYQRVQDRLDSGQSRDVDADKNQAEILKGRLEDLRAYMNDLRSGVQGSEANLPKPARKLPTVANGTKQVMDAPPVKLANEGEAAYLDRLARIGGQATGQKWASADHVRQILKGASTGIAKTEVRGDRVGTVIGDKWYPGTPQQIAVSMDPRFKEQFNRVDQIAAETKSHDPVPASPTKLDQTQLHFSFIAPRTTALTAPGVARALDKFGNPLRVPEISVDHFVNTREPVGSADASPQTAANQILAFNQILDESLDVQKDMAQIDPGAISQEARAQAAKIQPSVPTDQSGPNYNVEPSDLSSLGTTGQQRKDLIEANERSQSRTIVNNFITSFMEARRTASLTGNTDLERLANNLNDITAHLLSSHDLATWMKDPRTWFGAIMGKVNAMQMLYTKIGEDITGTVSNMDGVMQALDVPNEKVRQERLALLNDQDKAIADLLHHYWQAMGDIGRRTGVLNSFLEHYLPHIIEGGDRKALAPGGKVLSQKTPSRIGRATDKFGEFKWPTISELQDHLDELGQGGQVVKDVGQIFAAHGQGMSTAMLLRQFVNRAWGDFEVDIPTSAGKVSARPIYTKAGLKTLPAEVAKEFRTVKYGPMRNAATYDYRTFNRNNVYHHSEDLYVWKPLADQFERLASNKEIADTNVLVRGTSIARGLNNIFKQYKFKSPTHAWSMMSNIATMSSKGGFFGLPPVFNPTVWKIMGRGRGIVEDDRQTYYRALQAGLPAWKDRVPENMGSVDKVLEGLPIAGKFFKWFDNWMWNRIGYHGTVGLWAHLTDEALAQKGIDRSDPANANAVEAIEREMAYHARIATGFLTQLDLSKNWDLVGNTVFLANKWTTGQLRTLFNAFGMGKMMNFTGQRTVEGSDPEITDYLQRKNIRMAQRLVIGGTMRLLMTSMLASTAISYIMTGTPTTPIQNYLKDPNHTFDIYAGRDPQTNRDNWIRMPFYLFQRELVDYALAGVKAHNEGQDQWSTVTAPLASFAAKANPISKLGIELPLGQEIGKWMLGYGNDSIDSDKYITNLHKSLDNLGVPDAGGVENRIIYAISQLAPTPGLAFPSNLNQPTSDPQAVTNALGFGEFNIFSPSNWGTIALGALGTRQQAGTEYVKTPTGEQPIWQAIAASNAKKAAGDQISTLVKALSSDPAVQRQQWQKIEQLRQQAGISPGDLAQIIIFGPSTSSGGTAYNNLPPGSDGAPKGTKVLGGVALTDQQNVIYQELASQREELSIAQILNDPNFAQWGSSKRISEQQAAVAFADKITNKQVALAMGIEKGPQISNIQANSMVTDFFSLKKATTADLLRSPNYGAASQQDQEVMYGDRVAVAQNAVWDKYVGSKAYGYVPRYAGFTDQQLLQAIDLTANVRDVVRLTMAQLPSYVNAQDDATRSSMLSSALSFADQLASDTISGKAPKTFNSPLDQQQLYTAVRNGVVLQDEALNELYGSLAYQEADPANGDQNKLVNKYIAMAHNIALYDMREGFNVGSGQGYDNAIRTAIAADDAYQQLVDTYGGTQAIAQYGQELSNLKAVYKQENNIPPSQLSRVERNIDQWYYAQHPEYYDFLQARKNWEKYDQLGQAYVSIAAANIGFEANSPVANEEPPLQT